jgi:hypothetical protein
VQLVASEPQPAPGYYKMENQSTTTYLSLSPYPPQIPHVLVMALILPVTRKDTSNKLYTTACSLRNVDFLHTVKSIPKCL